MRIGIDIRLIGKKETGSEATFFGLVKNLARIDDRNSYKLFTDITDQETLENIRKNLALEDRNNFEIISLKCINRFSWNFWTLPKYLKKNPVDVYLTQYITPMFVSRKIKIVTIIHDISFNFFPRFIKFSDRLFLKTLIPLSLKRADKILGVSKFTRDEIIKYYKIDPTKVDFIYNAVSEDFTNQDISEEKKKVVREKYRLPEKFVLYIGTLQPRKNLPTLIESFAFLKHIDGFKLVVAGGRGHNYDRTIDTVMKRDDLIHKVIFPGFIDEEDKAAVMAAAEIFCFPSLYEGFGIPILEAMSVGTPVVASDIAPHHEIADEAALFFNPDMAGELAEKLDSLMKNSVYRDNLKIKGLERCKRFSWSESAEKILDIFENSMDA